MFSRMLSLSTAILAYATVTIAQATDSAVAQLAAATQRPNITTLFAGYLSSSAEIYLPGNPAVTQRWTLHDEPTYFGAIKVGTEDDVVTIVSSERVIKWLFYKLALELRADLRGV